MTLVLTMRQDQVVYITPLRVGETGIRVTVTEIKKHGRRARIGIEANDIYRINREDCLASEEYDGLRSRLKKCEPLTERDIEQLRSLEK